MLINRFVLSNVNYCPQVWILANVKSVHKIEEIQNSVLYFILNYYENSYEDSLKGRKNQVRI